MSDINNKIKIFHTESRRPNKDQYYLEIAEAVAQRSTCLSVCFGAIIVKDDQIISTGYVGAPRKTKDCMELGYCIRRRKNIPSGTGYEMCRSVHSEMNAIINAARAGVSLLGGDMYLHCTKREADNTLKLVKAYPCLLCKKMIINAGIRRFVGHDEKGNIEEYYIDDWVKDWQTLEDISSGKELYKTEYTSADIKKMSSKKK
jgi:dCMP deaminase